MIIKRVGGKSKIAGWIADYIPKHKVFVDVFGGSGAVLEAMPLERTGVRYVYNDLDTKLFNFFRVLRDKPVDLSSQIFLTPYSRLEFENAVKIFEDKEKYNSLTDLDKSVVFLVVNRQSFGAKMENWSITIDGEVNYETWSKLPKYIIQTANRFKHVFLENLDYRELIKKWDSENTCLYLDPPYEGVEDNYYEVNRDIGFDHDEMFDLLMSISGSFAVSYYCGSKEEEDSPLIKKYSKNGCEIYRKRVAKHLALRSQKTYTTEALIVKGLRSNSIMMSSRGKTIQEIR